MTVTVTEDFANFKLVFDIVGADISSRLACDDACNRLTDGADMNSILAFMCIMKKIKLLGLNHEFILDGACKGII